MDFAIVGIFKRSVTIERKNDERFETALECTVFVEGKEFCRTKRNVITVDGLEPGREYEIAIREGDAAPVSHTIRTEEESFLLNVRSFGACGDGKKNDTSALQAAIACCPVFGTVYVPAGTYLTGPLFLKSRMSLWIDEGAVLLGDTDRTHYPVLPGMTRGLYDNEKEYNLSSWEGNPLDSFASLITALDAEELSIIGRGTIDGNAQNADWWQEPKKKRIAWRPKLVSLIRCRKVRMQGLTLTNSACWCVHPYYSEQVDFLDLTIRNPSDSPNTDGFDPESCEGVRMLGSTISVGDDCVAIKSGKLYMARFHYKETKNVVIRNCRLERGHGSVTVGSEVAGGVRNVHVSQCIFSGTDRGVRIKTRRGRGERSFLTELTFENITMDHVHMPVTINMFYFCDPDGHTEYVQSQEKMPVDYRTPHIGSITVRNAELSGVDASLLCAFGLPEAPVERIVLEDIRASYLEEGKRTPQCPIMMDDFPKLSGRSLYIKNVEVLEVKDVILDGLSEEAPYLEGIGEQQLEGFLRRMPEG
ncbi:MAG: glycoside hydrolase family 28 protein [Lachnospiraceae bacterium]|nr:glycoside hydrolase family 28 protein [Lachnospiraceae bacterium]